MLSFQTLDSEKKREMDGKGSRKGRREQQQECMVLPTTCYGIILFRDPRPETILVGPFGGTIWWDHFRGDHLVGPF